MTILSYCTTVIIQSEHLHRDSTLRELRPPRDSSSNGAGDRCCCSITRRGARREQHGFGGLGRVRATCRAGSGVARTSRCTAMDAPVRIPVFDNQIEPALKSLKREMLKDGRFKEMKLRAFYEKPSVKRKRKQAEARKKRRKALARRPRGTDD